MAHAELLKVAVGATVPAGLLAQDTTGALLMGTATGTLAVVSSTTLTALNTTVDSLAMTVADQGNAILGLSDGFANPLDSEDQVPGAVNTTTATGQTYNAAGDYYTNSDTETLLLLHMDGANDGTTFADVTGKTVTPAGDAKTSTAAAKFAQSALLGGTGYLSISDAPDIAGLALNSGSWCIEWWDKSTRASGMIYSQYTGENNRLHIWYAASGRVELTVTSAGVGQDVIEPVGAANTTDEWVHHAVTYDGTTYRIFQNGALSVGDARTVAPPAQTSAIRIGGYGGGGTEFAGYIDELRVSGVSRYVEAFTPSTTAYVVTAPTMVLPTIAYPLGYTPTTAAVTIMEEDVDSGVALNTNLSATLYRNASNKIPVTLTQSGAVLPSGKRVLTCEPVTLTGTGTNIYAEITATGKVVKIHELRVRGGA